MLQSLHNILIIILNKYHAYSIGLLMGKPCDDSDFRALFQARVHGAPDWIKKWGEIERLIGAIFSRIRLIQLFEANSFLSDAVKGFMQNKFADWKVYTYSFIYIICYPPQFSLDNTFH